MLDKKDDELFIARNEDGDLNLFYGEPEALPELGCFVEGRYPIRREINAMCLPNEWFPEVVWNNSPQKVELNIKEECS